MRKTMIALLALGSSFLLSVCSQTSDLLPAGQVTAEDARADSLLAGARESMAAGKLSAAKKALEEIVEYHAIAPCAPQARMLLGEIEERRNDPRSAFKQYDKIVQRYQGSELYARALNRQLAIATDAAAGRLKGKVLWLWDVPMESSKIIEWLQTIIKNAPYADMSDTASSVLGDYLVRQRRYEEACLVYKNLVDQHPDSAYAPAAQLMMARLWASSHTRGDNNMVNLDRAQEAYEEFSLLFPNHQKNEEAKAGVREMRRLLLEQELQVGRYYLERAREYQSAVFCLEDVVRRGSVNPQAVGQAKELLAKARALLASQRAASAKN